jgi:hypothetical protein
VHYLLLLNVLLWYILTITVYSFAVHILVEITMCMSLMVHSQTLCAGPLYQVMKNILSNKKDKILNLNHVHQVAYIRPTF